MGKKQGEVMNKKAFTLIELLVVVLIIGILAAIALPQYEKAVLKARVAEVLLIFKEINKGYNLCLLENGVEDAVAADGICNADTQGSFVNFEPPSDLLEGEDCEKGGICFNTKYWQYGTDDGVSFYVTPLFGTLDIDIFGEYVHPAEEALWCNGNLSVCKSVGFTNCNNWICTIQ